MNVIPLSPADLSIAALMVIGVSGVSILLKLGLARQICVAGFRTALQLFLVGYVLKILFDHVHPLWLCGVALVMLLVAGHEVMKRQKHRFRGVWGFSVGSFSMFISSFSIALLALTVIIDNRPWYEPQYAIPLLGMLLGNTMSGVAIGLDRLTQSARERRTMIEGRLMLGQKGAEAIGEIRRDSIRSGLIPIINTMNVVGIVSLPGMMTGQILSGTQPMEAVKYQIMIIFLIAGGTGFGTVSAVWLGARRLFDERDRLRLDRLHPPKS